MTPSEDDIKDRTIELMANSIDYEGYEWDYNGDDTVQFITEFYRKRATAELTADAQKELNK